jgi:hypothetical protein
MRNVRPVTVRLTELADRLGYEVSEELWPFIADRIAQGEVRYDRAAGTLSYPDFVPVDQLVADVLEAMADGRIEARPCVSCGTVCDLNQDQGIFGDLERMERFVCSVCADRLSAREFYERYLHL